MNDKQPENFDHLKEGGFSIDECHIDLATVSVRCSDITRYKKALRVKIRRLIKEADAAALAECIDAFYRFAIFVEYLYGDHSCATQVQLWQEQVALSLQKKFSDEGLNYSKGNRLKYAQTSVYEERFKAHYRSISTNSDTDTVAFIQDRKPFLTLKDYAHFERWYEKFST
ncbi:MAG: hypothetical protein MUP09_03320 [Thiovulaceae bacterium]|nr:hypothetical protein [Sulfurimonadaceae bacterium]